MQLDDTAKLAQSKERILISRDEIGKKVKELGQQISEDYCGKCPILVGVLNGGFIFCADLFRELTIDCEVDFIKISSYEDAMKTSGHIKLLKEVNAHLEGRHVLVVEDIIDSGLSVQYLHRKLLAMNPASLKFVSLLVKQGAEKVPYEAHYVGFKIPNRFVVGYGLDLAQKYRNLADIYVMD
jgi:hypoxanthine phosphoribosyltransferase